MRSACLLGLKIIAALAAVFVCLSGHAQEPIWPNRPIKLVVPYTPGGGTDILGRMLGRRFPILWACPL